MRGSDIVTQLALLLPQLTDEFTNEISVNTLVRSGTVVTANCDEEHGLSPGDAVVIVGSVVPIPISSLTRSGTTGTLVTTTDHDRTLNLGSTVATNLDTDVEISGAVEAEFNGTFPIIQVTNRRGITFTMPDSGATDATGSPVLENSESQLRDYNSAYSVLEVPSSVSFTFTQTVTSLPNPIGTIVARSKARVSSGVSITRLVASYTEKAVNELWLFVVLEDAVASKSRSIRSDAVDNLQRGSEFRQQVVQPFTIYIFVPATSFIGGQEARDLAEDLFRPICRSLLFSKFDSGLFVGKQGPVQFVSHGVFDYNTAVYVHAYGFQQVADLVFDDTIGPDLDVAFRDMDLTFDPNLGGTTKLTATIDLDDVPL